VGGVCTDNWLGSLSSGLPRGGLEWPVPIWGGGQVFVAGGWAIVACGLVGRLGGAHSRSFVFLCVISYHRSLKGGVGGAAKSRALVDDLDAGFAVVPPVLGSALGRTAVWAFSKWGVWSAVRTPLPLSHRLVSGHLEDVLLVLILVVEGKSVEWLWVGGARLCGGVGRQGQTD